MPRSFGLIVLSLAAWAAAGCGIAFGDAPAGNDFFTSLKVSGDKTAGAPLTAAVAYETIYPSAIEIVCELRQRSTTLREIGRGSAPAVTPAREPEDDGVVGNFSIDFTVDEPGAYKVECYTVLDDANFIIDEFDVSEP